jgi:hypothetical protein
MPVVMKMPDPTTLPMTKRTAVGNPIAWMRAWSRGALAADAAVEAEVTAGL